MYTAAHTYNPVMFVSVKLRNRSSSLPHLKNQEPFLSPRLVNIALLAGYLLADFRISQLRFAFSKLRFAWVLPR